MAEIGLEDSRYEEKPLRVFPIRWRPIEELQPHEDVNPEEMRALLDSLKSMGIFFKPLLVDRDSGTLLDGTHRWAGLRELGAGHAPTVNLDYPNDEEIQLFTWYPVYQNSPERLFSVLDGLEVERTTVSRPYQAEDLSGPHLFGPDACYRLESCSLTLFFELEDRLEFSYTDRIDPGFEEEKYVFYRQPPDREEVIRLAREGRNVPAKSTRHWLPYKYQHIMVTLEELANG